MRPRRSLFILGWPLCVPSGDVRHLSAPYWLRSTHIVGGQALKYSLIGLPGFLPEESEHWPKVKAVLDRCVPGYVLVDDYNPYLILRYVRENPDKAKAMWLQPDFESAVYLLWKRCWAFPFRGWPDLTRVIIGSRKGTHDSQETLRAIVEGYHRLWPTYRDLGRILTPHEVPHVDVPEVVKEIVEEIGLPDGW